MNDIELLIMNLMDGKHTVRDIISELVNRGLSYEEAKEEIHLFNCMHPQADNDEHLKLAYSLKSVIP